MFMPIDFQAMAVAQSKPPHLLEPKPLEDWVRQWNKLEKIFKRAHWDAETMTETLNGWTCDREYDDEPYTIKYNSRNREFYCIPNPY